MQTVSTYHAAFSTEKFANESSALVDLRNEIKRLFIKKGILAPEDFYITPGIEYVPQKIKIKDKLDFNAIFQQTIVAQAISVAHQKDESFVKIIHACQAQLQGSGKKFAALIIMAGGSGQLTPYLINHLSMPDINSINRKIYSVDLSQIMNESGFANFHKYQTVLDDAIDYHPITADCTSHAELQSAIPELLQTKPLLVISHGGARYFIKNRELVLLESFRLYPQGSSIIITEVGNEHYELLQNLATIADATPELDVTVVPQLNTSEQYACWNLTFFYFLMQQYLTLVPLQKLLDALLAKHKINHSLEYQRQISLILLEIAGMRKQTVHSIEINCH